MQLVNEHSATVIQEEWIVEHSPKILAIEEKDATSLYSGALPDYRAS